LALGWAHELARLLATMSVTALVTVLAIASGTALVAMWATTSGIALVAALVTGKEMKLVALSVNELAMLLGSLLAKRSEEGSAWQSVWQWVKELDPTLARSRCDRTPRVSRNAEHS